MITTMHGTFNVVLWVVCITALVVALVALATTGKTWRDFGKSGLLMDSELARDATRGSADSEGVRQEEIRQMIEARNARRRRRGEQPLDVEEEIARLSPPPTVDRELQSEIRELVVARNYRRTRAGKPPLDVDAEIQRELEKVREIQLQANRPRSG